MSVNHGALVLSILIIPPMTILPALRWSVILATMGRRVGVRVTYPLVMIGLFYNQCLPFSMGDFVRMWFAHRTGLTSRVAFNSVMLDRLAGIFALLVMVTAALPRFFALAPSSSAELAVETVLALGYGGFAVLALLHRLPQSLRRFRIAGVLVELSSDLRRLISLPRAAAMTMASGILIQLGAVAVVYLLAWGLALEVSVADCLLIVPMANLIQSFPISIGGWGVREGFFVAAFGLVGLAASSALAVSVLYGLVTAIASLPGGVLWMIHKRSEASPPAA